ncbi:MAG TPA: hypothetical protein VHC90_24860 [Bryobacteraceae bacterium]|nr:hypothetical protein [Bryobacteraceae bacterium]
MYGRFLAVPLLALSVTAAQKPAFDVVSIKPAAPLDQAKKHSSQAG